MYDVSVIGSGPAGLSAAITARTRAKEVVVISNHHGENALARAGKIINYPGFENISGIELLDKMSRQAQALGARIIYDRVISIFPDENHYNLSFGQEIIQAKTIVICSGILHSSTFKGEETYLGKGVSYCATCDGMLYKGRKVAVIGLMQSAVEEANFLNSIGCDVSYVSKKFKDGLNSDIAVYDGILEEVIGSEQGVCAAQIMTDEQLTIDCDCVFILRPAIAPDYLLGGLEMQESHIKVDANMTTKLPGVFAAGDCTGKPYQISKATGDGQKAVFSAIEYIKGNVLTPPAY